jgi:hypothetical protein
VPSIKYAQKAGLTIKDIGSTNGAKRGVFMVMGWKGGGFAFVREAAVLRSRAA